MTRQEAGEMKIEELTKESAYVRKWRNKKYMREPWYKHYRYIVNRCSNPSDRYYQRGIKNLLTLADVEFLWKRDKAHLLKRASIDRIDGKGNYVLDNCQFIELSENKKKISCHHSFGFSRPDRHRAIAQLTLDGKLVKKYPMIISASRETGILYTAIRNCLGGRSKHSGGYRWIYQ